MKCPHCRVEFYNRDESTVLGEDADGHWKVVHTKCPACSRFIIRLVNGDAIQVQTPRGFAIPDVTETKVFLVRPKTSSRPPCPTEVPKEIATYYEQACLVLSDSPEASAALSRKCLQHILREVAHVKPSDLAKEIQEVLDRNTLPSYIASGIDAVRNIGNFAAHPLKSQRTGEIISVEQGEAEWNLDILETLFDFYYVQPAILQQKREALNQKLKEAGKPPMK